MTYIGFKDKEFKLNVKKDLGKIVLIEKGFLDEVVVGLRQSNEGDTIFGKFYSGEDLTIEPIANVNQALQGKAAGVKLLLLTPGSSSQVIIRGLGTIQ